MPRIQFVLAVLWTAILLPAHAAKVTFGESSVKIPAPDGFVQVSEESGRLPKITASLGSSTPIKAAFVPQNDSPAANDGAPTKVAAVFAIDSLAAGGISVEKFARLVAAPQSPETLESLKAHMQLMSVPIIGAPPGSNTRRPVPADITPPHLSTDRQIALSMRMLGKTIGPGGIPMEHKAAYTTAFVLVRGMVIRLVVHSESDGVAWTQETCRAWAEAIIAENPAEPGSAGGFSLDAPKEAFDNLVAALPLEPVMAKARTLPWLGTLSPTALKSVLGVAALAILLFALALVRKIFRRLRG